MRWKKSLIILGAGILGIALLTLLIVSQIEFGKEKIRLSTGSQGLTFDKLGRQLVKVLNVEGGDQIEQATAVPSTGSLDNISRVASGGEFSLGFAGGKILGDYAKANPELIKNVQVVASLYEQAFHVLVKKTEDGRNPDFKSLEELQGEPNVTIYVGGGRESATYNYVQGVLQTMKIVPQEWVLENSPEKAIQSMLKGKGKCLCILIAGAPAPVLQDPELVGKVSLLPVSQGKQTKKSLAKACGLNQGHIGIVAYPKLMEDDLPTLTDSVFLIAHRDVNADAIETIRRTLQQKTTEIIQDVPALRQTFHPETPTTEKLGVIGQGVQLHSGTVQFEANERTKVVLLAGGKDGSFLPSAQMLQQVLQNYGVETSLRETEGTIENLTKLNQLNEAKRPAIALAQYDVALACLYGRNFVYRAQFPQDQNTKDEEGTAEPRIRRTFHKVSTLHEEYLYVFENKDTDNESVCLGPPTSGTRMLAQAVVHHLREKKDKEEKDEEDSKEKAHSISSMVAMLREGKLKRGFLVSTPHTRAIQNLLACPSTRLVKIRKEAVGTLGGPVLRPQKVSDYLSENKEHPEEQLTLATDIVLLANDQVSPDTVRAIATAVHKNRDLLGLPSEGSEQKRIATGAPALELHPAATEVYEELGLLEQSRPDHLIFTIGKYAGEGAVILGLILSIIRVAIQLLRHLAGNHLIHDIAKVDVISKAPGAVEKLRKIQKNAKELLKRGFWNPGAVTTGHWAIIEDLVAKRIDLARESAACAIGAEIRELDQSNKNPETKQGEYRDLRKSIWMNYQSGDISASQHAYLLKLLDEAESGRGTENVPELGSAESERETVAVNAE